MIILGGVLVMATASAQTPPPPTTPTPAQTTTQTDDPFPDGPGKSAFMKVCANCHAPDKVVGPLKTRAEWSQTIDDMARFGAEATDQEFAQIQDYLVAHFSPIGVNKATAKELAATLDVPAAVAEAIVKYREEKGPFASADDLTKVPGLETAKVDARKKRLVF